MTIIELRAAAALRSVKVAHVNWQIRCKARLIRSMELCPGKPLLIADAADLWFLVWRYRRQIADAEVLAHADELVNGARSLAF
ncbi:MAG TPA: hypothetical protein VE077_17705 [Candidatus Methylomirabilis sp.]|nr:hypothetical protein [Candidatus Methylomirabilis sp.]